MFSSPNKSIVHLIEPSHGRSPRSLRIVLRVDLWGGHFWVARSLRVGCTAIALRRRRWLVIIGELVFIIRSENRRKARWSWGMWDCLIAWMFVLALLLTVMVCLDCWGPKRRSDLASCSHHVEESGSHSEEYGFLWAMKDGFKKKLQQQKNSVLQVYKNIFWHFLPSWTGVWLPYMGVREPVP